METTEAATQQPPQDPSVLFRSDWLNINDDTLRRTIVNARVGAHVPTGKYDPTYVSASIVVDTESGYTDIYVRMAPDTARNLAQQLIAAANACDALEDREAREQAQADDVMGAPV